MLEFPAITALTAGALIILQVVLAMKVSMARMSFKQSLGDGGKPEVIALVRGHGNLVENAPIILILLGLLEVSGANSLAVAALAVVFMVGRVLHPIGISMKKAPNAPRFIGSMSSHIVGLVCGGWLIIIALGML